MKTYIYTYRRGRQDPNGNPKHWITVYRVKNNAPIQLGEEEEVGYRGTMPTACQVIADQENWGKTAKNSPRSGSVYNGVAVARFAGKIRIIQI